MPYSFFDNEDRMEKAEREMYGDTEYEARQQATIDKYGEPLYHPKNLTMDGFATVFLATVVALAIVIWADDILKCGGKLRSKGMFVIMYALEAGLMYFYIPLYVLLWQNSFEIGGFAFFVFWSFAMGFFIVCFIYIPFFIRDLYRRIGLGWD